MRRWLWLLVTGCCLAATPRAAAQGTPEDSPSDKWRILEDLPRPEGLNLEDLLRGLNVASQQGDPFEQQLKKFGVPRAQVAKFLNDPAMVEKLKSFKLDDIPEPFRKALADFPRDKLNSALSSENIELLKKRLSGSSDGTNAVREPGAGTLKKLPEPEPPGAAPDGAPAGEGSTSPDLPPPRNPSGPEQDVTPPNSELSRSVMNWARRSVDPSFADSPAIQKAIRDLSRHMGENDPRWQELSVRATAIKERFSRLGESLHLERLAPRQSISWPRSLRLPSLPRWRRPPVEEDSERAKDSLKRLGDGDTKGWQGLLTGLVLGLLGVVAWTVLTQKKRTRAEQEQLLRLGPWPVNPRDISTREELIRAFEHLSLLWLGSAARNWNHEVIAERIGSQNKAVALQSQLATWDSPARQQAAEELAAVYERARYAPPAEPLADETLAAARRDLCFLAGMQA